MAFAIDERLRRLNRQRSTMRLAERHYKEGVLLMRAERWEEGASQFRDRHRDRSADGSRLHYNLGQCRMAQKRFVDGCRCLPGLS